MKVASALATGNSVIVKVSEFNPFSAMYLGELSTQAGLPDGTINILAGAAEAGQAMGSHMSIREISFTGSPIIGRKVQVAAAQSNLKRVTLELDGKSPVLIFDGADLENALQNVLAFLTFNGQGCVLGTRVYIQETIATEFIEKLTNQVEGAATMLASDPFDKTSL
jgi:aldehyde dehydrogenase (NAD+)